MNKKNSTRWHEFLTTISAVPNFSCDFEQSDCGYGIGVANATTGWYRTNYAAEKEKRAGRVPAEDSTHHSPNGSWKMSVFCLVGSTIVVWSDPLFCRILLAMDTGEGRQRQCHTSQRRTLLTRSAGRRAALRLLPLPIGPLQCPLPRDAQSECGPAAGGDAGWYQHTAGVAKVSLEQHGHLRVPVDDGETDDDDGAASGGRTGHRAHLSRGHQQVHVGHGGHRRCPGDAGGVFHARYVKDTEHTSYYLLSSPEASQMHLHFHTNNILIVSLENIRTLANTHFRRYNGFIFLKREFIIGFSSF